MANDKIYHLALIFGSGKVKYWNNNHNKNTCVLVARLNVDYLPTDINQYLGQRVTTKASLKSNKDKILKWINKEFQKSFKRLIID